MFVGDCNLKKLGQKFGGLSPPPQKKIWRPKTSKFRRDFGKLRDVIANISGLEQAIVDQKTALQAAITPVYAYKFGELRSTKGEK